MGGLFVLLGDRINRLFNHLPHHGTGDRHCVFGRGVRQARVIARVQRRDLELGHTAADNRHAFLVQFDADVTGRHPADHRTEQFGVKHRFTGRLDVAINRCCDAHLHVVAGQGQFEPLCLQIDALQHRDGCAVRNCAGYAFNRGSQQ